MPFLYFFVLTIHENVNPICKMFQAHSYIAKLSKDIKEQCEEHLKQQERLIAEQQELERERVRFEREKERARQERQRVRKERQAEKEKLDFIKSQQEGEWLELEQTKMHVEDMREKGAIVIEKQKVSISNIVDVCLLHTCIIKCHIQIPVVD